MSYRQVSNSMNYDEIEKVIIELAKPYAGRKETVDRDTSLNTDLGIDGDEAEAFLAKIANIVGSDVGNDFVFETYFGDEAPLSLRELTRIVKGNKRAPLRISELARYFFANG